MENKHDVPEYYKIGERIYDIKLLRELNAEYSSKPYINKFNEYTDEYQMNQARNRLKKLSEICMINDKRVLEIGCGGGYVSCCLAKDYGCQVIGIDIYSSEHWNQFEADGLEFRTVDLSVENPFPEESFDIVLSYVAWEHMRHPFKVLQECARITKINGAIFICANLYRSPIASHLYRNIFFPWPHLLFDDEIVVQYALEQGVEQWWIDAFYYVNKLTYAEYKEYFSLLKLELVNESFNYAKFDWEFYRRFEDKLGLYPIHDLQINFFNVLLEKHYKFEEKNRLAIEKIEIDPDCKTIHSGDCIKVICTTTINNASYAYYLYKDGEVILKIMYQKSNSHVFEINETGAYYVKVFAKDGDNKVSEISEVFEVV